MLCNNYGRVAYLAEDRDTFEFIRLSENRYLFYFKNKTDREEFINTAPDWIEGYKYRDDFNLLILL